MPLPLSLIILKIILLKQVLNIKNMKDNYPMGAALDPLAPYNQPEDPKPVKIDCSVCYCMSKSMPVMVNNYSVSEVYESDIDDEKHSYCHKFQEKNFDDTNFIEEFKNDGEAIGIPTLLKELSKLADYKIEQLRTEGIMLDENDKERSKEIIKQIKHYQVLIKASEGWLVDDLDVCQE